MGSVYRKCPNCFEHIGGYWDSDVDKAPDDPNAPLPDPANLTERMREHAEECPGSFESGAAVAFGLMGMVFAIRSHMCRLCGRTRGHEHFCAFGKY